MGVMMSGFFLADSWGARIVLQRAFSFSLIKWRVRGIVSHENVFVLCVLGGRALFLTNLYLRSSSFCIPLRFDLASRWHWY